MYPLDKDDYAEIERILLKTIDFQGKDSDKLKEIHGVIETLERLVDLLRYENGYYESHLKLEDFLKGDLKITGDTICYEEGKEGEPVGGGIPQVQSLFNDDEAADWQLKTPPICFQPKALMFLMLHYDSRGTIIDLIEKFVRLMRPSLTIMDFEKTKTGVTRCYTNTRFAVQTLRDYGLLLFTKKEAYRKWSLSLPGFVVAAGLMEGQLWSISDADRGLAPGLHPSIKYTWDNIQNYDAFIKRLSLLCKDGTYIFNTFKPFLKKAYDQLPEYWAVLKNENLPNDERTKKAEELIGRLGKIQGIDDFYNQFSRHMNIEELKKRAGV